MNLTTLTFFAWLIASLVACAPEAAVAAAGPSGGNDPQLEPVSPLEVVNHETVREGEKATEYVSIYEVRDGLIQSVRFVRD